MIRRTCPLIAPSPLALGVLALGLLGCGDPGAAPDAGRDAGQTNERVVRVPPSPEPPPTVEQAEVAEPAPPDMEELARQREEAARLAFEARYPMHGITFHFLARVRTEPNQSAAVAGYMRRGARFRASERVPGVGCARGWFEVPGQGFVCRGEGFLIGEAPPSFEPVPVPPALEDALPYEYASVARDDEPEYWHLPTPQEDASTREIFARMARVRAAAVVPEVVDEEVAAETAEAPTAPGVDGEGDDTGANDAHAVADPALVAAAQGTVEIPGYVRLRMRRGFYVSLDEEEQGDAGAYYRTVRGGYVRSAALVLNEPAPREGVVLDGDRGLPLGFVWRGGTMRLRRVGTTDRFREVGSLERHTTLPIAEMLDRDGRSYVVSRGGDVVRRSSVRIAAAVERPAQVSEDARWIHVSLAEQTLVAYEGDRPVFATTTSTGREGFETPTGLFRIQSKHVSTTMDDLTSEDEAYLIEDVPWTMYFEGNFALHAAFWHQHFGRPRSHGCVNLAPADARWIFQWSGPELPSSWHGVFADRTRAGTWIYITAQ